MTDLERSTFQGRPCYRYIRSTDRLPLPYADQREGLGEPVLVKLFNPQGAGTWFITAYDPETRRAYGAVDLGYGPEVGAFDMAELIAFRGCFGLPLERDLWWTPKPLRDVAPRIFEDGLVLA
jgi:hypothetical protein